MDRVLLLCLIIANAFACLAISTAEKHGSVTGTAIIVDPPASSALPSEEKGTETGIAEAPMFRTLRKHHQCSKDKSVVGGVVILGGLGTTMIAVVFWYIRITRRQTEKPGNPV
ncbi:uncharacterized protein [Aristolochia californica]|uniref:uncharacterized protein n=1 Tax=Aristolochia californica TaxID=171875 RepID=UPI0035D615D1